MLQLTHPLITKANPTTVKADPTLRGLNTAFDNAFFETDKGYTFPLGERRHSYQWANKINRS
jgi:hypothetical protein